MKNEYNDPEVFEREFHLFYKDWIWSERVVSEISEGNFTLCKLPFGQEVLLTKANGVIKAFLNVCPHRKSSILVCDSDKLACSFHGWEYDSMGNCTKTPGIDSIKIDRIHLHSIKVENYCDYIFLNFHRSPVPFTTWIERYVSGLPYRPLYLAGIIEAEVKVNWKLAMENELDGLHVNIVHKELRKIFSCLETDYYESKITPIRGLVAESQRLYPGVKSVSLDHKRIDGETEPSVWGEYKIFPHMAPAWMDDYSMVNLYSPISPELTLGKIFFYVYDKKFINNAKTAIDLWDSTMKEDVGTMEANHRGNLSVFYNRGKITSKDEIGLIGVWEKEYKNKMKEIENVTRKN